MAIRHGQGRQAASARNGQDRDDEAPTLAPASKPRPFNMVPTTAVNPKRVEARDRRLAAIHEAGHHVMACHRGMREVDSWIERVGEPTQYETSWAGQCRWRNLGPTSRGSNVMIGVAGMIAEALWKAGNDPARMDSIYDLLGDPKCMSESDWRNAGLSYEAGITKKQCRQIEATIDLLSGPLWSEVLKRARTLIIESRSIDLTFMNPFVAATIEQKANRPSQSEPPVDQPGGRSSP